MNNPATAILPLFTAIAFLTRLPVPRFTPFDEQSTANCSRWFGVVGLIVGAILATCLYAFTLLFGQLLAVVLTLALGCWLTGCFHEDGFADVCDGFGGGYQIDKKLAIMKDSCLGAYGVIGLIGLFAIKAAALMSLPLHTAVLGMVLAHAGSRSVVGFIPRWLNYAADPKKSKSPQRDSRPTTNALTVLAVSALVSLLTLPNWQSACIIVLLWLLVLWRWSQFLKQQINGYNGDALGAGQQIIEALTLVTLVALNRIGMM
ncbi:adenosylcobinamide-GDP ribazoletransferase [Shewanella sp. TC10]|uniref:adenosylcobinamide-GDP ribazoletransferase n=1 Tax=Shewanella sp. TC10 TaxID=1419739 RepID=UPI00189294B8|nr:adenosylcobinamide-GDP ribazoletransferase [Shewanella sp. TC10]